MRVVVKKGSGMTVGVSGFKVLGDRDGAEAGCSKSNHDAGENSCPQLYSGKRRGAGVGLNED